MSTGSVVTCPLCGEATLEYTGKAPGRCLNKECRYHELHSAWSVADTIQEVLDPLLVQVAALKGVAAEQEKLVRGINWMLCSFGKLRDQVMVCVTSGMKAGCSRDELRDMITSLLTEWRLMLIKKAGYLTEQEQGYVL